MRFLTDALLTQDQQFIEKYSMSNLIDYSHEQDLQDMNSIPTVNMDKSHQDVLSHESEIDHKLDFLSSRPLGSMDKFLIRQVSWDVPLEQPQIKGSIMEEEKSYEMDDDRVSLHLTQYS